MGEEKNPQTQSQRNLTMRALPMECLGAFALCYVGGMAVVAADQDRLSLTGVALAHGITLALFVYIGADISGGHFNPAVSLGMFLLQKERFQKMLTYMGAQLMGGLLGGAMVVFNLSDNSMKRLLSSNGSILGYPTVNQAFNFTWVNALISEVICTLFLILSILMATETYKFKPEKKGHYALCIGLTLSSAIFGIGNITGGALNPIRVIGP